ncbi:MAG: hypothetical protein WC887_02600 [Candidatus Paceibacterota bacterium]|jgi:hypothetical protein
MGDRILSDEEVDILLSDEQISCPFYGLLAEFTSGRTGQIVELEGNCALMFTRFDCLYLDGKMTSPNSCCRLGNTASKQMIRNILLPNFTVNLGSKKIPAEEYFSGRIPE